MKSNRRIAKLRSSIAGSISKIAWLYMTGYGLLSNPLVDNFSGISLNHPIAYLILLFLLWCSFDNERKSGLVLLILLPLFSYRRFPFIHVLLTALFFFWMSYPVYLKCDKRMFYALMGLAAVPVFFGLQINSLAQWIWISGLMVLQAS